MSAPAVTPIADSTDAAAPAGRRFLILALELLLILLVVRAFRIEERRGLFAVLCLAAVGAGVWRLLPAGWRPAFFLAVSLASFPLALGWTAAAWVIGVGSVLIAACHLPVAFRWRVVATLTLAAGLTAWRSRDGSAFWAVLGSLFMFRLFLYLREQRLQERRGEADPAPWPVRLSYFFLLPNAVFPFFPIVDYRKFRDGRTTDDDGRVAQRGVAWMLRGVLHLLLYRAVKTFLLPWPQDVVDAESTLLFLATNYALYLRISGHFHIITGMLHLFGFDLPRTHDRFFLASSLSDIWRRINIYWKDFLADNAFYPTYFALRRWPRGAAVVAGVAVTFAATWLLHSWQAFWLLGDFPLDVRDAALWMTAGSLVAVNALWQYRAAARHAPASQATAWTAARLSLQVVGTFLAVSFFWACWTFPRFPQLLASVAWSGGFGAQRLAAVGGILAIVVVVGTLAQLVARRLRRSGVPTRDLLERSVPACVAALLLLTAAGQPQVQQAFGHDAARTLAALQSDAPPIADAVAGYYDQLAESNLQADPLLDAARRADRPNGLTYGEISRERGDLLGSELKPGFTPSVYGAPFRVNRWGMRDDDVPKRKPPGVYRIAVLGSSTTLGHGVPQDEDFESLLERRLAATMPPGGPRIELLNFAGPGFYALHSAAVLREQAFAFEPDAVYYVAHQGEYFGLPKHLARSFKSGYPLPYPCLGEIVRRAGVTQRTSWGMSDVRLEPFGKEIAACVYRGIVADCRRRGVLPVWIYVPIPGVTAVTIDEPELKGLARQAGFVIVDLSGWPAGRKPADVKFDAADYHANALGHRLIANRLFAALRDRPDALPPLAATLRK